MDRTEEKLLVFSDMVLKDAARQKQEILDMATQASRELVEASELRLLQQAHDEIQEALRSMGRASNEEISRTILESKQALFTRRREIVDAVFERVQQRLDTFRATPGYRGFLSQRLQACSESLGDGEAEVLVDEVDLTVTEGLVRELGLPLRVTVSPEPLGGGCLYVNHAIGRMRDESFARRMETERDTFLERYELSLDG
jgi:vacuolar-type H+-ATPase subunit E/Vma4